MPAPPTGISARYRIEDEVGRGGMAVVYRALDTALNRPVAIKALHPHLQSQPESRLRFAREAQAVAKLHHPNIVEIYDYSGEEAEVAYIVTEFIAGETLEALLRRRRLRLPETGLLLGVPICEALGHAHALGVIHRDVKPGNVMLRDDGTVKLMDFGIAQIRDALGLTVTGTFLGSPAHMSPEHIEGKTLDTRADVFSLGTLLYLLTVGELPFQGRNPHVVMKAIMEGGYRRAQVANPRVSAGLDRLLARALERDPARRYESVDLLLLDLRAYLGDLGIHDLSRERAAFFADPDGFEEELHRRLVAARLSRGREALGRRRHAAALEEFNQVLALDPRNWEVLALLARLGRRRLWERAGYVGALLLLLALFGWWLWPHLGEKPPGEGAPPPASVLAVPPLPPPPTSAAPPAVAAPVLPQPAGRPQPAAKADAPAPPPTAGRPETRPRRRVIPEPRRLAQLERRAVVLAPAPSSPPEPAPSRPEPASAPPPPPAPAPEQPAAAASSPLPLSPREVRINTWPKAVKILVDGNEVGWAGIVDRLELLPGKHLVRLESPSCHPQELEVPVPADGPVAPIVARLAWKPALLEVENPQNADVAVDGVYKGTSERTLREPVLVHIDKANPLGRIKVHVRVSKPGMRQEDRVEEVAAGRLTRLRVVLKPQ